MAVRDTSLEAYDDLPRSVREHVVFNGLVSFIRENHGQHPTGYELFLYLRGQGLARDLNAVRPRLTDMQGRCVETLGKRACEVTGKTAYEWSVIARDGRLF